MKTRVSDIGEDGLIRAIRRRVGVLPPNVITGIGDDAALLRRVGPHAVLTTDLLIEGVDFERHWASFGDIGVKAAAVNLSDLAGMGAKPRALLLALAFKPEEYVHDILNIVRGVANTGRAHGAPLVGGDLSRTTGPLVIAITAVGEVASDRALLRHRGKPNDLVLTSGDLGAAAAGLILLRDGQREPRQLIRRQLRPRPCIELGLMLAGKRLARSAADISDGLARDALHVAGPGCGVELDVNALPISAGVRRVAAQHHIPPWQLALTGGEDFGLVIAVKRENVQRVCTAARICNDKFTVIGKVTRAPGLRLRNAPPNVELSGFDHFRPHDRTRRAVVEGNLARVVT